MKQSNYVEALLKDPSLSGNVRSMLDDGEIDRVTAELAWIAIVTRELAQ
jgi:hypothetical protein